MPWIRLWRIVPKADPPRRESHRRRNYGGKKVNRKIVLSVVALAGFCVAAGVVPASSEQIAAVVEVESISRLIADIDSVAGTLYLSSQGDKIMGNLERMFGSPGLAGIDTNKTFHAYVLLPKSESVPPPPGLPSEVSTKKESSADREPAVVFVLPLKDKGKLYLQSVSKSFERSEKIKTAYHFSVPRLQRPEASPDLYVMIAEGNAIVGPDLDNIEAIEIEVVKKGTEVTPLQSLPGAIRLGIDVQACLPLIKRSICRCADAISQSPLSATPGTKVDPAKMLEAESEALLAVLRQIKSFSIGIGVRSKAVEIYNRIAPVPETILAGILKNLTPPSDKYLSALPADAYLAVAGSGMNAIDEIIEPYCDMLGKMYAAMGPETSETGAQIQNSMRSMKGMYSGEYAIGVIPGADGKGISLVEIFAVNDSVKMQKLMEETFSTYNEKYGKLMRGMTITTNEPRTYKDVKISSYSYSVDPSAQEPVPLPDWLKNLKLEMAFVGNDMIFTMHPPAVMNAAIDRLKNGGARLDRSSLFTGLFPQMSAKPVKVYGLSLVSLIKAALGAIPNANVQMLAMIPDSAGGLGGYSIKKDDNLLGVMRISMSEMTALKNSLPLIGVIFTQTMLKGTIKSDTGHPDQMRARCVNNLRVIDAAKEQCAMEMNLKDGDEVNQLRLKKYLSGGKMPICPAGGKYTINPVEKNPECSIPGHSLE